MPVDIIPENRRRTAGENFAQAFSGLLGQGSQFMEQQKAQKMQQQAAQTAKEKFGIDITGFDPETQKALLVEAFKQQGQQGRLGQKQEFLSQLLGGGQPSQKQGEMLRGDQQIQQQGFDPSQLSDAQIAQVTAVDPNVGRAMMHAKDVALREKREETALEKKEFGEERTYHTQFSKPAEEKVSSLRSALPKQEAALNYARQAIESGEVGAFTMNHLAELTGADSLRNAKGAQLILAAKEQLLPSLGRISAKAQNQYMEKRMASMIPQVGAKDEANLTMQEMLEAEAEMDKAYLSEFDRLAEKDMAEHKFVKKDIEKRARDATKHKDNEIAKRTSYRMKEIEEEAEGLSDLRAKVGKNVTQGTPLTLSMANLYVKKFGDNALDVAKKNGYYIPTREELMIFEQRPEQYRENL